MKYKFEFIDSVTIRKFDPEGWLALALRLRDEFNAEIPDGVGYWTAEFEPEEFLVIKLKYPFLKEYEEEK